MRVRCNIMTALICGLLTVAMPIVQAQDTANTIGHVSIASPTAASLGKYGDVPVSYNTGIPQVGVPVYTVESGSLKLPVSLSYHASGLKVQESSSWVGAGWSLNAGGVITRTVVGSPDDRGVSGNLTTNGHYTDYGFNSYLIESGTPDDIAFARGYKDGEPDLYFFNFGGVSGKFYFNDDRTPMIVPEQDYKIEPFYQLGSGFLGFIITTSDGTKYYFGQTGNNGPVVPKETTIPATVGNGAATTNGAASSWFLNKIMSADGADSITLTYAQETYSYYTLSLFPVLLGQYSAIAFGKNGVDVVKNLVSGVRLRQIDFANGHVAFTPSATPRQDLSDYGTGMTDNANTTAYALGSISIYNNNGFCKKDSLFYGYWQDGQGLNTYLTNNFSGFNIHSDAYRLRLDSIRETTCDNLTRIPPYKFSYFSGTPPRKLSFGVDHWGFANGADTNKVMVPTYQVISAGVGTTIGGANRDAAWPAMQGGSLQQITYPTGGTTTFQFEPKGSYTPSQSIYSDISLATYAVNYFGQAADTMTQTFDIQSNGGACTIHVTNYSPNYYPTMVIRNSSNVVVYNSYYINVATKDANGSTIPYNFNGEIVLPGGTYTGTLSFAVSGTPLEGGAYGSIGQWQYHSVPSQLYVSGLRIRSITNNDGINPVNIITSYSYPATPQAPAGGILYSIPVYVQVIRNDLKRVVTPLSCSPNGCQSCDGFNGHDYFVSPGSIQPLATMQGENMGYNKVEVARTGQGKSVYLYYGTGQFNGNTQDVCVRTLTNSSACSLDIPNFPFAPLPFDFMRGELQYEGHFNESGAPLKETRYNPEYKPDPLTTPGIITVDKPGLFSHTEYQLQNAYKSRDRVETTVYDQTTGTSLTSVATTYYGSPYHHQATRKVLTTSTGDSLATNIKYALDYRISSCDAIPDSLGYYQAAVHADTVWLAGNLDNCTPQTNDASNCRLQIYAQFRAKMAADRVKLINYRRRSYLDAGNLLSSCYLTAGNGADVNLKPVLRLQSAYFNAPLEITEWKDLNLRHASFTKYDTSLSPLGFVYPGRTQLINLQAMSASFAPSSISGNTITKDSRYQDESSFKFLAGNPVETTGKDGIVNAYIWDYLGKEPVAKVINGSVNEVSYTSFEADGNGGWTVPSTIRDTVNAITGRKSYLLSNGACSRAGLTSGSKYVVSYWSKTGSSYSVTGSAAVRQGKTIGGWTYFEHTVTGTGSTSVTGTGGVDELRCYPLGALMTTYTYQPLVGMTSSCDQVGRVTYYSYDSLGRMKFVKDQDGNIVKTVDYHYKNGTGN